MDEIKTESEFEKKKKRGQLIFIITKFYKFVVITKISLSIKF